MIIRINKLDGARTQLTRAIKLFFENEDPISTHSLAGCASRLISDLTKAGAPDNLWDRYIQEDNGINAETYYNIAREAQNFLKHADLDAESYFDLDTTDTECLILISSMNLGEIDAEFVNQSVEIATFRAWYFASRSEKLKLEPNLRTEVQTIFPKLHEFSRNEQLIRGLELLTRANIADEI